MDVFKYLINRENTVNYFLETNVFEGLKEIISDDLCDTSKLRFILTLTYELYKQELKQNEIVSAFISQGCLEGFLMIVQKYKLNGNETIGKIAFRSIINITIVNDSGKLWLEVHHRSINDAIKTINDHDLYKVQNIKDEIWNCVIIFKNYLFIFI